ncbi:MAG: hypothetical protein LBB67_01400 [Oscillospiraceae bacterium]|jgi:hypothetical protein|nr:hypothetical protein [Oscillospiraceae bacterium]
MKKFSTLIFALVLVLSLAACGGNGIDTNTAPSATPSSGGQSAAATDDLAVYQFPENTTLPRQKEITVTREGFEEAFVGTLVTSSRFNYSIYMLPDFEFLELDDCDYIRPIYEPGTVMPVDIGIKLYSADSSQERRDDIETDEKNEAYIEYAYWKLRDIVIQVEFTYTFEMADGMAVLMRAMAETMQDAPVS